MRMIVIVRKMQKITIFKKRNCILSGIFVQ